MERFLGGDSTGENRGALNDSYWSRPVTEGPMLSALLNIRGRHGRHRHGQRRAAADDEQSWHKSPQAQAGVVCFCL